MRELEIKDFVDGLELVGCLNFWDGFFGGCIFVIMLYYYCLLKRFEYIGYDDVNFLYLWVCKMKIYFLDYL